MTTLIRTFGDHHQSKDYKTRTFMPRSCGHKYRIICTGEIILRFKGKVLAIIDDIEMVEYLLQLRGKNLDYLLQLYIDGKLPMPIS